MLRVTTIHASSAGASADYYAKYLTQAPGEARGVWTGNQADEFGLAGEVSHDDLFALLEARDPVSGTQLGRPFRDRELNDGRIVKAVAGFDATFSAPKSVSVLWALTQDERLLEAHDTAVTAALAHLDRFGSTTRVRKGKGERLHPDTGGLTIATFRQTTSRADDPDLHTHSVISNKVRTSDGRWLALDGAYMKRHQRMLGGIYQSVLRNELTHRFGFDWDPIENGQAEIAGIPKEVLRMFSKRTVEVEGALEVKIDEFAVRQGREPSEWERAALTREAAVDTRSKKSGRGVADLVTRWADEAHDLGWSGPDLVDEALHTAAELSEELRVDKLSAHDVIDQLSAKGSVWNRADIMQAICDLKRPMPSVDGERWALTLERACDSVIEACVGLDPIDPRGPRRTSDGRSVWVPPIERHITSESILAEEDFIISWAMQAQEPDTKPSTTVVTDGLDVMQAEVARAVAGHDRLVLAVGPAGAGKTTTLRSAVTDLVSSDRSVFGVAPSAKAARVLARETGVQADTLAKLLYEWERVDRAPHEQYQLPSGATLLVDEAGMVGTFALSKLVALADRNEWRVVLVGDHHQLQAVGRGGMFHELCLTGRAIELDRVHRFNEPWEATASLQLRHGGPRGLDAYFEHDRVIADTFDEHLERIAKIWLDTTADGDTIAITAGMNEHVDKINAAIQHARRASGQIVSATNTPIGGDEFAYVREIVVTRQNDRRLETSTGEPVRNRESWIVESIGSDGSLTVSSKSGSGQVTLPPDYVAENVRLGYAATEHGNQGDTVTVGIELATVATTQRGLYVGVTRGREENQILVVTDSQNLDEARDILERILASDRVDLPATAQRRVLAEMERSTEPHRPKRIARCSVPSWFADLRADVVGRLAKANADVAGERRQVETVEDQIAVAKRDLTEAERAIEPFQRSIDQATQVVNDAQNETRSARRLLDRARRVKRPAARRDAMQADEALKLARDRLDEARELAASSQQRIDTDRAAIEGGEASIGTFRTLQGWSGNETRRDLLVNLDGALAVWDKWAAGGSVEDVDLASSVKILKADNGPELRQPLATLADAVTEWAHQAHPVLLPHLKVEPRAVHRGLGLEM